ncbi:hypothetical protein PVA38_11255 [Streptococcus pneumoniae D39]|nr:hypothetical protein PVA38_11255 [Streptococcus pneumoniae D39]
MQACVNAVSYTHLRAHETVLDLVCRLLLEKKKNSTIPSTATSSILSSTSSATTTSPSNSTSTTFTSKTKYCRLHTDRYRKS